MTFDKLIQEKINRLESVPLEFQTAVEKQQTKILKRVLELIQELTVKDGYYEITAQNLNTISNISDELKKALLTPEYLKAVKTFASEISVQALLTDKIIEKAGFTVESSVAATTYINIAQKSAIESLIGAPIDKEFIRPIQSILENAIINGAKYTDTIDTVTEFIKGTQEQPSKLMRYSKQVTYDTFAMADRSYASIVSDTLNNDWFYYSGTIIGHTRCFCKHRVFNYYHYKEIESWGNGDNLGVCDLGNGTWSGEIAGTNSQTIYTYLGGWQCQHFLIPVSEFVVPESDIERTKNLGYI